MTSCKQIPVAASKASAFAPLLWSFLHLQGRCFHLGHEFKSPTPTPRVGKAVSWEKPGSLRLCEQEPPYRPSLCVEWIPWNDSCECVCLYQSLNECLDFCLLFVFWWTKKRNIILHIFLRNSSAPSDHLPSPARGSLLQVPTSLCSQDRAVPFMQMSPDSAVSVAPITVKAELWHLQGEFLSHSDKRVLTPSTKLQL